MQIGQMDEIHPFGHAIPLFLRAEDPAQVGRRQPFPMVRASLMMYW